MIMTIVVSYSISTSNHNVLIITTTTSKVVSYSISTSNHNSISIYKDKNKVVSYSISTSNHNWARIRLYALIVVSYSISTSNHNVVFACMYVKHVVSYSISTSNHNSSAQNSVLNSLYLIPFLHQTTTALPKRYGFGLLYLIPFLHQTTTCYGMSVTNPCCILFHFYIKPQPMAHKTLFSSTLSPKSHSHFHRNAVV